MVFSKKLIVSVLFLIFSVTLLAKTYLFGVSIVPLSAEKTLLNNQQAYEKLTVALSKKLQQPVKMITYYDEKVVQQALLQGKIDFAYLKVIPYAETQIAAGKVAGLVTTVIADNGVENTLHTANIISLKENNLAALKNKRFGFVKNSTSGSIYPLAYMQKRAINYKIYFSKIVCYQNQYELLQALNSNQIDAGAIWSHYLSLNKNLGNFKVIATISNIPNPVIAASYKLTEKEKAKLKDALLQLPDSSFNGLSIVGFKNINNNLYKPVIRMIDDNPCF